MTEAQIKAQARYNKKLKMVCIKLNPDKDADIIAILETKKNKSEYIKALIRKHDTQ